MSFDLPKDQSSIIKVIGVGGGGSNAVNHMFNLGIRGVNFVVCNTDAQALEASPVPNKIQLGSGLTEGRGAGSIPDVGKNAAIENLDDVRSILAKNTKMVFITAGMGGGTGTGAAPIIASAAKEMGILTVGIVTIPFAFEGKKRKFQADEGLAELRDCVDTLLVISNEKLREMYGNQSLKNAFSKADDVLATAAKSIAEIITMQGYVNVDFADVRTVMSESGNAIMGSAAAEGENRALVAVENALASPLLDDNDIRGARYVLLYITFGNKEVLMDEITEITDYIQEESGHTADVIFGTGYDESLGDKVCVTVIATGFESKGSRPVHTEPSKMVLEIENPNPSFILPQENPSEPVFTERTLTPENNSVLPLDVVSEPVSAEIEKISLDLNPVEVSEFNPVKKDEELSFSAEVSEAPSFVPEVNSKFELPVSVSSDEPVVSDVNKPSSDIIPPYMHKDDDAISPEELFKQKERMVRLKEISHKLKNPSGLKELESQPAYERRNVRLDSVAASDKDQVSSMAVSANDPNGQVIVRQNSFLHGNVD